MEYESEIRPSDSNEQQRGSRWSRSENRCVRQRKNEQTRASLFVVDEGGQARFILDIVVLERFSIFELLATEDESLWFWLAGMPRISGIIMENRYIRILILHCPGPFRSCCRLCRKVQNVRVIVLTIRVFTKICIAPRRRRLRWSLDSLIL